MTDHMKNEQTDTRKTAAEAASDDSLAGLRVLLVEDNEINWKIISELLKAHGIASYRAENGRKCLEMLSRVPEGTFGLILMDVQMPVMGGLETTRTIRRDLTADISKIPIIALTADIQTEDIAACQEAGMDSHISKPVDVEILLKEIRRVLEAHRTWRVL